MKGFHNSFNHFDGEGGWRQNIVYPQGAGIISLEGTIVEIGVKKDGLCPVTVDLMNPSNSKPFNYTFIAGPAQSFKVGQLFEKRFYALEGEVFEPMGYVSQATLEGLTINKTIELKSTQHPALRCEFP